MILYPHQQQLVDRNPACHLLAFDRGTGKTITSIALAEKNCLTCLVVVPKMNLKMWIRETEKWGDKCTYTIITKEEFRKNAMILPRHDGVIVDEAHYFAGEKSQMAKSMYWYLNKRDIKYRWLCTATPYLSTPMNIYVLKRLLGYQMNWMAFRMEYFYEVKMGIKKVWKPKPYKEDSLAKIVSQIGTTVDMEEAVALAQANPVAGLPELQDVPEQSFETEYFDMTQEQKDAILLLNEPTFITRWTKMHCIENGLLYSDGYTEDQAFDCKKTDRIMEICKANKKVAIFCRYNAQVNHLKELLEKSGWSYHDVFVLNGDTKDKDATVLAAEASDHAVIIIQAQCSAGYELPSFGTIVFASLSFSFVDYTQAVGRFLRINKMKENRYYHLVTNGVDRDIYDCIMKKQDFSFAIYGKDSTMD